MKPLVSIVIPCWNGAEYVADAIESALKQTYDKTEVIVIDDGSTDASLEVMRSFGSAIRVKSQDRKGGCCARNRGIELANGEYIQFLDCDDVLLPEKLARQVPVAIKHSKGVTYTDHQWRGTDRQQVAIRSRSVTDPDPFIFVLHHRTLHTSGPLYHRSWLMGVGGFKEGLTGSQEFELNLRVAAHLSQQGGYFVHLSEVLFEVRRRPESVSSDTARTFAVKAGYLPEIVNELEEKHELTDHRRAELAAYSAGIGRQCIRGGQKTAGLELIRLSEYLDKQTAEARAWGFGSRWVKRMFGAVAVERIGALRRKLGARSD